MRSAATIERAVATARDDGLRTADLTRDAACTTSQAGTWTRERMLS
jgi:hypothetical protein